MLFKIRRRHSPKIVCIHALNILTSYKVIHNINSGVWHILCHFKHSNILILNIFIDVFVCCYIDTSGCYIQPIEVAVGESIMQVEIDRQIITLQ